MKQLENVLLKLGQTEYKEQLVLFERYRDLVLEWNEKVNLTAIKDPDEFEIKHFIDSILILTYSPWEASQKIIDIGTGAGFPGVPLAILFPKKQFVLVDSLAKRIKILREITKELGLQNVTLLHGRAEELGRAKEHREKYDLCVCRAVADLAVLAEYCLPFVRVGGYFAPYKTKSSAEEIKNSQRAIQFLGGKSEEISCNKIEGIHLDHQILWIKKTETTRAKYPRKAGMPTKEPLK